MSGRKDRYSPHLGSPRFERSPPLSSNYRNKLARKTPQPGSPPPFANLEVTGTLTPDATGTYIFSGYHGGHQYYRRLDHQWFIWWKATGAPSAWRWRISNAVGSLVGAWWTNPSIDPADLEGGFNPEGTAVGTATVAEL